MNPTDQQIRVAVAQALGWKRGPTIVQGDLGEVWIKPNGLMAGAVRHGTLVGPPDYPNSDAACREMRMSLDEEEQFIFTGHLETILFAPRQDFEPFDYPAMFQMLNSSPRQQALAFLKTKNLMV